MPRPSLRLVTSMTPHDFASGYVAGLDDGSKLSGDQNFLNGLAIGIIATVLVGLIVFAVAR